ncbi:hypothetical protein PM02_19050 [Sulfitobacter mediterraneus]|uniref:Uncharacterized protein n=2 Tax=Sulfitobacter mediterraneus TaxID=83219 RepID=A0A061SQH3_9RHOB|nr:hypothetical protein PM02_19050 [Sulfitobacter mediterraneus]
MRPKKCLQLHICDPDHPRLCTQPSITEHAPLSGDNDQEKYMTRPTSPTARHLFDAIDCSPKTQKEIAKDAGFASPNILSMMKSGETKVPISRIPSLSQALSVAPGEFINIALREYHPDLHEVLSAHYGAGLSLSEKILLEVHDEAQLVAPFVLEAGLCDLLLELFVFSGRLQAEIG